jgi:hypothetical protein
MTGFNLLEDACIGTKGLVKNLWIKPKKQSTSTKLRKIYSKKTESSFSVRVTMLFSFIFHLFVLLKNIHCTDFTVKYGLGFSFNPQYSRLFNF